MIPSTAPTLFRIATASLLSVMAAGVLAGCAGGTSDTSRTTASSPERPSPTSTVVTTTALPTTTAPATSAPTTTAPPSTTTSPPTTASPPQSPSWDEIKMASIPEMCSHPPTTLVDGRNTTLGEHDGHFEVQQTLRNGQPGLLQNVPSDAGPLTAVNVSCSRGGVGWPNQIMFFAAGGVYYAHIDLAEITDWGGFGLEWAGREGVEGLRLVDSLLEVYTSVGTSSDAFCCASGYGLVTVQPHDGRATVVSAVGDLGD